MKTSEKLILLGALLVIVGVFLPWHTLIEYVNSGVGGGMSTRAVGSVIGTGMVSGWAVLVAGLLLALLVLIPFGSLHAERVRFAQYFLATFIAAIVALQGLIPAFVADKTRPDYGLLFLVAGVVLQYVGIGKQEKA